MSKIIIEADSTEQRYWRDLWLYRELFYVLAWRDIAVRYKQTAIGVIWAIIQPLATMLIFTVIFHHIAKMGSNGIPYMLVVAAGTLPWQFFSAALSGASQSLVGNANLISKVYFPRMIVPAGAVVTAFVDFMISFALIICVMAWYHYLPTWRILFLPLLVVIAFLAALGPGLLITALNVKYRDFRYIIPFILQFGTYISPVGFSSTNVPEKWRLLYSLNPMVGVIDGFRWSLLADDASLSLSRSALSLAVIVILLAVGIRYFRNTERTFADVI
jgi:lipopolysaccharide transport system permease protein